MPYEVNEVIQNALELQLVLKTEILIELFPNIVCHISCKQYIFHPHIVSSSFLRKHFLICHMFLHWTVFHDDFFFSFNIIFSIPFKVLIKIIFEHLIFRIHFQICRREFGNVFKEPSGEYFIGFFCLLQQLYILFKKRKI